MLELDEELPLLYVLLDDLVLLFVGVPELLVPEVEEVRPFVVIRPVLASYVALRFTCVRPVVEDVRPLVLYVGLVLMPDSLVEDVRPVVVPLLLLYLPVDVRSVL